MTLEEEMELLVDVEWEPSQAGPPESPPLPFEGGVYFLQCNEFVKIGKANNVARRIASLQNATPYTLVLRAVIPTASQKAAFALEAQYQKRFRPHLVGREWFQLATEIEAVIAACQP